MKSSIQNIKTKLVFLFFVLMNATLAMAQEGTGDGGSVTVSKTTTSSSSTTAQDWYTQPWVWIVGAAVFILLLIALIRGGSSVDRTDVHRTTTVRKDVSTE